MKYAAEFRGGCYALACLCCFGDGGKVPILTPDINAFGTDLLFLAVDSVSPSAPMPCAWCGSKTRPTSFVTFASNVSLLIVRYQWNRKGYCCLICALKYFIGYTTIILVAGWWSITGLLHSPLLLMINLLSICMALLRYRRPLLTANRE
ncbi:MAG: hypothetical protein JWL77_5414 [Chthonomonadaceae bacterium]|nr:hypothetical protein [Chthonomonadaceae bacterium]